LQYLTILRTVHSTKENKIRILGQFFFTKYNLQLLIKRYKMHIKFLLDKGDEQQRKLLGSGHHNFFSWQNTVPSEIQKPTSS